jgi:hypothetical protein
MEMEREVMKEGEREGEEQSGAEGTVTHLEFVLKEVFLVGHFAVEAE